MTADSAYSTSIIIVFQSGLHQSWPEESLIELQVIGYLVLQASGLVGVLPDWLLFGLGGCGSASRGAC